MEITAAQLAALVHGEVEGDATVKISTYSKIEEATEGSLSFLANPKYTHFVYSTEASALLVYKDFRPEHPVRPTLIRVDDPYSCLAMLLNMVSQTQNEIKKGLESPVFVSEGVEIPEDAYIGAFSYIGAKAKIGARVAVYPQCYIGENVEIGEGTILYPGVKIYKNCKVGANCIIHAGAVIGSDGFGFAPSNDGYTKIAQIGNVVIEDSVEIGANTAIDRATMGSTIIRMGSKLDNLIQVAHNVEIGENTVIAAQAGIAGSTKIGSHNMIGGQVGFAGHINIGNNNQFGAQSGIHSNIGDNRVLLGYPAIDAKAFMKQAAYLKQLGNMFGELSQLKEDISALKNKINE